LGHGLFAKRFDLTLGSLPRRPRVRTESLAITSFRRVSPRPWLSHLTSAWRLSFLSPGPLSLHRLWPARLFSCPLFLPSSCLQLSFLPLLGRLFRCLPSFFFAFLLFFFLPFFCLS